MNYQINNALCFAKYSQTALFCPARGPRRSSNVSNQVAVHACWTMSRSPGITKGLLCLPPCSLYTGKHRLALRVKMSGPDRHSEYLRRSLRVQRSLKLAPHTHLLPHCVFRQILIDAIHSYMQPFFLGHVSLFSGFVSLL